MQWNENLNRLGASLCATTLVIESVSSMNFWKFRIDSLQWNENSRRLVGPPRVTAPVIESYRNEYFKVSNRLAPAEWKFKMTCCSASCNNSSYRKCILKEYLKVSNRLVPVEWKFKMTCCPASRNNSSYRKCTIPPLLITY